MARYLVLHGLHGSQGPHWQRWIAGRLRERGDEVAYPALPQPDAPRLETWLAVLDEHLAHPTGLTVLCHSLGCILWLHHAARRQDAPVDRVLLNAPPEPVAQAPSFFPVPLDAGAVRAAARTTRIVCSDNDPYAPRGAASVYGEPLGLPVDLLRGCGHVNVDAGFGPWPELEQWCLGQREALAGCGAKNGVET